MVMMYYKWRGSSGDRMTRGKVYEVDSAGRFYEDNGCVEYRGFFDPTYWKEVDTPPGDGSVEVSWHPLPDPLPDPLPVPPFVPPPPASPSPPPDKTRYYKWIGYKGGLLTFGKVYRSVAGVYYSDAGSEFSSSFTSSLWKEVDKDGEELSRLTKYNSNDHNPKGDTIMLDFNKKSGTFIRVYGVELTDKTDDQLMSMIREAKEHIKSLEDLKDVSTKVASKIKEVEASIKTMVTKLDSGEE